MERTANKTVKTILWTGNFHPKSACVCAVGAVIGADPIRITGNCRRVMRENGAFAGYRGGPAMKAQLLVLGQKEVSGGEVVPHA
ncbi:MULTISPECIES: MGMT family protein [Paenibacillus]|uniref:MGMT family protein n=1 Tax=Paenibacillus TaxID=44249 RepID=UPI0022B8706F|nr:MGMT family protein [Paenibacillus caseinilyticus]MCZ8518273.1 MGMT family protein [Paenibacillus caseinilyticus]